MKRRILDGKKNDMKNGKKNNKQTKKTQTNKSVSFLL
jgi:hypothetical protein